ncbi:hypothetical protein pb186bvf_013659 [Paramecium bursaria]
MKRASQLQIQREAIVFSSDDSMNSDNSFQSSVEEDETDDYKNTVFHLKEQMGQFFANNPELKDAIKFEDFDENKEIKQEEQLKKQHNSNSLLNKSEQAAFAPGWKVLGKDVIRNSQGGQTLPTLETINHRLNIFKQKVEKIDYLEILQRETQQQQKQDDPQNVKKEPVPRSQSENVNKKEETKQEEQEDITYFSFKKKMQLALHKRQQMQKEEEERKLKQQRDKQKKGLMNDQLNGDATEQQTDMPQGKMEFQTHVGQMLYQTYQQTNGDKESFKKMAAIFLKNYHKKQKENLDKLKVFPPVIPKFTSDDCKHLNLLLPDFSTQLYAPNKQNLFQGVDSYKFPANSPEQEFINLVDQIMQGKVMQFWKEMHQQI